MSAVTEVERGFNIVRRLDVPHEPVFQAWTDPEHLHWLAGTMPAETHPTDADLRVGGAWRLRARRGQRRGQVVHDRRYLPRDRPAGETRLHLVMLDGRTQTLERLIRYLVLFRPWGS